MPNHNHEVLMTTAIAALRKAGEECSPDVTPEHARARAAALRDTKRNVSNLWSAIATWRAAELGQRTGGNGPARPPAPIGAGVSDLGDAVLAAIEAHQAHAADAADRSALGAGVLRVPNARAQIAAPTDLTERPVDGRLAPHRS